MKIGLARRGYSPTGGAEAYLLRLAGALGCAGHEVLIFSDRQWPEAALLRAGVELGQISWEAPAAVRFAEVFRQLAPEYGCDFVLSLERVWSCDAYRAGDGVHAAWLERRADYEPWWRSAVRRWNPKHRQILALERALFTGGARRVIANSRMVRDEIVARFGYPAERIDVIYNGAPCVLTEPAARAEVRKELALAESDYVALFAGSGWERKGLRFAIEAVNALALPGARLLVAGSGRARALPRSARTRFLGARDDVPRLLAAADVFILPTIYDPFSNACLEALGAGLPVITTKANGFAEIIEPGVEGEIVESPDDIRALTAALSAWAPPERRAAVRERLRAKAAEFTIERNVRETLDVFARLAGEFTP